MAKPREYRLLPLRVSAAQTEMDVLVPALWDRMFPGPASGPNHRLERIFGGMRLHPERSALQVCPYYFDQAAWRLPVASPRRSNLELRCFDSWADVRRSGDPLPGSRPHAGVYLSRLCRTGGSMTTQTFVRLMYDYSG